MPGCLRFGIVKDVVGAGFSLPLLSGSNLDNTTLMQSDTISPPPLTSRLGKIYTST
jgi:hypothetical protein